MRNTLRVGDCLAIYDSNSSYNNIFTKEKLYLYRISKVTRKSIHIGTGKNKKLFIFDQTGFLRHDNITVSAWVPNFTLQELIVRNNWQEDVFQNGHLIVENLLLNKIDSQ
jgi:hypothetical protein